MDHVPPQRRRRKVLRLAACGMTLIGLGFWTWLHGRETRSWELMERRLREIDGQIAQLNGRRPVLRGDPVPGDAWEDYNRAIERVRGFEGRVQLWKCVQRDPTADRSAARRILVERAEALEWMRKGTRREDVHRTGLHVGEGTADGFFQGSDTRTTGLVALEALADCQAFLLAEEGRDGEAAELWLDLAQYSNDLWREGALEPGYFSVQALKAACQGLSELLSRPGLSEGELRRIDQELAVLEDGYGGEAVSRLGGVENWGQVIASGRVVEYYSMAPAKIRDAGYGWLIPLFSSRLALAASFHQQDAWMARLNAGEKESWPEELRLWSEVMRESSESWNLINRLQPVLVWQSGRPRREGRATLRLLRVAAHYRATGDVLDLPDPFGDRLRRHEEAGVLRVWSLGLSGQDGGGAGGSPAGSRNGNIVLEIPR
ncbi:MAG TPA: hypothetical protein VKW04_09235 [Planctomycetota bacterium]|nr:hypothetical protein [Planctomycetota bacterium]